MERSYDAAKLREASEEFNGPRFPYQAWLNNKNNVMWIDGDDIGLATWEYPGVYTVHWFFVSRGRRALDMAQKMLLAMFEDYGAKVCRGMTPEHLKAARWMAKQVGFKSYGVEETVKGPHEIIMITKDDLLQKMKGK